MKKASDVERCGAKRTGAPAQPGIPALSGWATLALAAPGSSCTPDLRAPGRGTVVKCEYCLGKGPNGAGRGRG